MCKVVPDVARPSQIAVIGLSSDTRLVELVDGLNSTRTDSWTMVEGNRVYEPLQLDPDKISDRIVFVLLGEGRPGSRLQRLRRVRPFSLLRFVLASFEPQSSAWIQRCQNTVKVANICRAEGESKADEQLLKLLVESAAEARTKPLPRLQKLDAAY